MNATEKEKLFSTLNNIISGSNGWDVISKFFRENENIRPYFEEVSSKLIEDQCYSLPIMYVSTIEKLLDVIDDLKSE